MNLRDYLHFKRMTLKHFSEHIGYARNHLSGIINGRLRPSLRLAKTIEDATDGQVTAEEMLKEAAERKKADADCP